ncbi:MAG: redox-sensing transcriptional repressor Rex [Thermaerobacter sp.]|nr:redox-sensing transcriptional repressor Rex [Thermaerobacter sp.]
MKPPRRIPAVAVRRLPLYLRVLEDLAAEGVEVTSSADLATRSGYSSEQIRKDLAYFGAFGTRGLGYDVAQLTQHLRRILGLTAAVPVALVGAGNLGTALIRYASLGARDTYVAAVFDADPKKIGTEISGLRVRPMHELMTTLKDLGIRIAVIAVPEQNARDVFDQLCAAEVKAVLNFAPAKLEKRQVSVQNVDLTTELQSLAYFALGAGADR